MNESQPTNSSHTLLLVLVLVSVLLSLGTVSLFIREQGRSERVQQELMATINTLRTSPPTPSVPTTQTPTNTNPQVTQPSQDEWATTIHDGVSISYPKTLSVTTYADEFAGQQQNLRISSSASRKVGINSKDFEGYELVMRKIDPQQYSDSRTESTVNPLVSSLVEMCDGTTCPDAQYIFTKNGNRYLIETLYQMKPYQAGIDLNNRIIASIK